MSGKLEEADQAELLRRIADKHLGAPAAVRQLYQHYRPRLLAFLRRKGLPMQDCEDLLQEIFIKVVTRASQCTGSVSGWIYQIARNQWLDLLRHKASRPDASGNYTPIGTADDEAGDAGYADPDRLGPPVCSSEGQDGDPLTQVQQAHDQAAIDRCVREAMQRFRQAEPERAEAIHLTAYEDWPIEQVATYLGRTAGATRQYLSQCRKKLKDYLAPCQKLLAA